MPDENKNPQTKEDKAKKNIFAMTFEKLKRGKLEVRKKNLQKGSIYLTIAFLILIPYSIWFLYPQLNSYLSFNQVLNSYEKQIEDNEVTITDLIKTRDLHKAAYEKEFKAEQDILKVVFPEATQKLEVIKLMENFATQLNAENPPFEFTSINFELSRKENNYTVLPFQTSIHSSQNNFETFLGLIKLSGDYDPNTEDHIRLMSISNITLKYRGVDKNGVDQGVDFNVKLLAYSR